MSPGAPRRQEAGFGGAGVAARRKQQRKLRRSGQRDEQSQERMTPWEPRNEWGDLRVRAL